jgi:hypothetical protein
MNEPFPYADGELRTVGAPTWTRSSGTSDDLFVASSKVVINDTNNDDDTGTFIGAASVNSGKIFASFTLLGDANDVSTSNAGSEFFAAFGAGTARYARIFPGHPGGTTSGFYRLGITNAADTAGASFLSGEFSATTAIQVVIRFDYATSQSTLWVNPTSESDAGFTAVDALTPNAINRFAFRQPGPSQGTAMGDYSIDNLLVGTSFADVVPEPGTIGLLVVAGSMLLGRRRA